MTASDPGTQRDGKTAARLEDATALAWTDDGEKILAVAVGRGMQPPEILGWWPAT